MASQGARPAIDGLVPPQKVDMAAFRHGEIEWSGEGDLQTSSVNFEAEDAL